MARSVASRRSVARRRRRRRYSSPFRAVSCRSCRLPVVVPPLPDRAGARSCPCPPVLPELNSAQLASTQPASTQPSNPSNLSTPSDPAARTPVGVPSRAHSELRGGPSESPDRWRDSGHETSAIRGRPLGVVLTPFPALAGPRSRMFRVRGCECGRGGRQRDRTPYVVPPCQGGTKCSSSVPLSVRQGAIAASLPARAQTP